MKKIFTLCMLAGLAGATFTACDDDNNYTPVAPEVNIQNVNNVSICKPGETVSLKAQINETIATQLQWTVNGQNEEQDSLYAFSSSEVGMFNVKLTASNESGTDADSLSIMVTKVTSINDITNWTGEGDNRAVLAIQWVTPNETDLLNPADENIRFRAWGFRWNNNSTPTGLDMAKAIAAKDPRLFIVVNDTYKAIAGFIYDENNDGIIHIHNDNVDLTQNDFINGIYNTSNTGDFDGITIDDGDLWLGGYLNTYASYFVLDNSTETPIEFGYNELMVGDRLLSNDSWDVWTYSTANEDWLNTEPHTEFLEAAAE